MYIADLHIHSRYSRATSRDCTPEYLDLWARRKGIHIVGTGDFTHPAWREELKEKLEPAEAGLYTLKESYRVKNDTITGALSPRFVITGEISSIYKKGGRVRKVHNLIILPGLEDAEVIASKLEAVGNIHSDGRPILGLDCHDLLEIILELCSEAIFVPAHIWTPHFSLFGAFSGFDTVEECFGDLSPYINAVETGLSSDPPMNWRVSTLDKYQLISNSDAHSPSKLGREANLLDVELSYRGLQGALQEGKGLCGTIEFFPEEGKYHFDGHRKCNICLSPLDTQKYGGICPVCGRRITIGVSHRVEQLADRQEGFIREKAAAYESLVPLPEVIGASAGRSATGSKVQKEYLNMLRRLGPEFDILRTISLEEIRACSGYMITEGIRRLREGKVERIPGFDGEYGTIKLFEPYEIENMGGQISFFDMLGTDAAGVTPKAAENRILPGTAVDKIIAGENAEEDAAGQMALNSQQDQAVKSTARRIAVIAGPGTGKTKTLVSHLINLLEHRKVKPSEITAVTFTNQAAAEMRERVQKGLGKKRTLKNMQSGTFHAVCLSFLREQGLEFMLADELETKEIAKEIVREYGVKQSADQFLSGVSLRKSKAELHDRESGEEHEAGNPAARSDILDEFWERAMEDYQKRLRDRKLMDFDDLLLETLKLIESNQAAPKWEKRFSYLLVDEFQDINPLQYRLIKAWNEKGRELFVIGDPDQSIYGFRGADDKCFARLKEEYEELEEIRLLQNYRSTPQILDAARQVISGNPGDDRILQANRKAGVPVRLARAETEMGEAIFIAKEINRMAGGIGMLEAHEMSGAAQERKIRSFDDIAILYRTHRQAELLEKCLAREGIPYVVAGRETFLKEDAVRGSICFFRYLDHQQEAFAKELSLKLLWNMDCNVVSEEVYENTVQKFRPLFTKKKPRQFLDLWIGEMGFEDNGAMKKLAGMAIFYKTMADFMEALYLGVESDLKRCGDKHYTSGSVRLMTLHGAKGLEFPAVFICGARKGTIPYEREKHSGDIEEERRLLYVGMTRAKEELIMTCSGEKSQFIEELPGGLLTEETAYRVKETENSRQMSLFELYK